MIAQFFVPASTVDLLAQVILHFLWQGALFGLAAACLLHVSPIRTARGRYAFHCGLLTLLAISPVVTWQYIHARSVAISDVRGESADESGYGGALVESETNTAESSATQTNAALASAAQSVVEAQGAREQAARTLLAHQREWIVGAWLIGVGCMAARLLLGVIGVRTLARRGKPIPAKVTCVVERLSRQLAFRVRPAVHVVERISQAMAVGVFRPMVLLPAAWISELPSEVLEAVIAHELAHLRRWDLPINFVQRAVETLLFFHPVVWWCSRQLRREREMCCDELAQAAVGSRVVYAKALAYLAHQQCSSVELLLAAGIGGAKMVLLERIYSVLGMTPVRHGRLYGPSCALVGAVVSSIAWLVVCGLPSQWQPQASNMDHAKVSVANAEPSTPDTIEESISPDEVAPALEPRTLEKLKIYGYSDLSLAEAVKTAMANSKAARAFDERSKKSSGGDSASTNEAQQTPAPESVPSAGGSDEVSLAELELGVRNLLNDTESAYWELSFAWRNLENLNTALNGARQTWKKVHVQYIAGDTGNERAEEAQAREQYFQFKCATQTLLDELVRTESRLRYLMGVSPTDGQLIRPIDKPTVEKVDFDWNEISEEALARDLDLRRQRWRIKQRELELTAAKNLLQPHLDLNGKYRWLGLGNDGLGQKSSKPEWLDEGLTQEFALGLQSTVPLGFRQELAKIRSYQLQLARERAKLQEEELEVSHQLVAAVRQLELNYQLTQTNFNRVQAANRQVEAVQAAFETKTVTIDQLLEAQRRRTEAQASYFRTLLDYQRAILAVQFRKGLLL